MKIKEMSMMKLKALEQEERYHLTQSAGPKT